MKNQQSSIKKKVQTVAQFAALVLLIATMLLSTAVHALPSVSITTPTTGQEFTSGQTVPVAGVATPLATVEVLLDGSPFTSVVADGSGDWNTAIPSIVLGSRTVTARVVQAPRAFVAANSAVNHINPAAATLNEIDNFPATLGVETGVIAATSPNGEYVYVSGYQLNLGYLARVEVASGTVSPVAGISGLAQLSVGAFSSDGSKYYAPDVDSGVGAVYVIDVATNTVVTTLTLSSGAHNMAANINDMIYVNDVGTGEIHIIDPTDDTFTTFVPSCATMYLSADPDNPTSYWAGCGDGNVIELLVADNSVVTTIVTGYGGGIPTVTRPANSDQIYITNILAGASVLVHDITTTNLLTTIPLTNGAWSTSVSADGAYVMVPMSGISFDGTDVMLIATSDYSTDTITIGDAAFYGSFVAAQQAEDEVQFSAVAPSAATDDPNQQTAANAETTLAATGMNQMVLYGVLYILCALATVYVLRRLHIYSHTRR